MFIMKLVVITFMTVIICSTEAQVNFENFGQCYSPNRVKGWCVYLNQCTDLYTLLQKKPLHEEERNFLSKSQCGYYNQKVLICCTNGPINKPKLTNNLSLLPKPPVCGGGFYDDRIYGGNSTEIDEFPWMVLLEYTKPGNRKGFHCGGSLINNRYVITASHCVNGRGIPADWSLTGVRLGEWDTSTQVDCRHSDCADPVVDVPIERAITHEDYDPNSKAQYNDIALLRLSRDVQFTDWIKPVCLPTENRLRNNVFDGHSLDVAGWGKTEKSSVSNIKLKARVNGVKMDECNQIYSRHNVAIRESQICAGGERGIDSCRGDSGGPLVVMDNTKHPYFYLAGIVSFGPTPCGLEGWPGVYTKVGSHIDWIGTHISP